MSRTLGPPVPFSGRFPVSAGSGHSVVEEPAFLLSIHNRNGTRMRDTSKDATYLYLLLTLAFSAVFWALIIWSGHLNMGFGLMVVGLMWCPALAAVVSCRLLGRSVRSMAWRWPNNEYM